MAAVGFEPIFGIWLFVPPDESRRQRDDKGEGPGSVGPLSGRLLPRRGALHLYVLQAVDRGLAEAEADRTLPHEQVADELRRKWVLGATT